MIGQFISKYRILSKLGEGGMGVVYLAEDTKLGRQVAIKTLTDSALARQDFRSRFLREARAVSALTHANIATIYDYGETADGMPYIVMELVKGQTLANLINESKLTIERAIEIIIDVAKALAEAHRCGIIHRDIKPSNVAINERGHVKVLDFGLAKQIDLDLLTPSVYERQTLLNTQTREGAIVGTPMYLSPEQVRGVEVDARSDLFSLGALLYECITGTPPFRGDSPVDIFAKVIRDDPLPPSRLNPRVPVELDQVALKALAKNPDARFRSADEMIVELQVSGGKVSARGTEGVVPRLISTSAATRASGTLGSLAEIFSRPRISVGYVVAATLVITAIAVGLWFMTRARPYQPKPEPLRLYGLAVDAMREGAFYKASKRLQQAVQDDPLFALAWARLAEAWTELDSSDKAKDALIRAKDLVADPSVLPVLDGLRLQAVTETVKRDYGKAVEHYRAIASSVPEAEKPDALVDVGRAYEKNEQSDKAIETYQEATRLNSHQAAAFLRLGVLLGRRSRYLEANASLDQAYHLFDIGTEIEGLTEVLLQRAVLLALQGKVTEARTQLLGALEKSTLLEDKDKGIKILLNLSNTEIVAGNPDQAQQYSSQAVKLAQANGLNSLIPQGIIDIGNAYLIKGQLPEAEKNFDEALRLAKIYQGTRSEARALLSLSSLRSFQGDTEGARDFFRRALPFYEQGGYRKEVFQAYVILGRSETTAGDYDAAQQRFEQLLQLAKQASDSQSIALAQEGLGGVFLVRENFPAALTLFKANYEIVKSLNAKLNMGYTANNEAEVQWRLGHYEEARAALVEALSIAQPQGRDPYKDLLLDVHLTTARLALSERNVRDVLAELRTASDIDRGQSKSIAIEVGYISGLAQSLFGHTAAGRKQCEDAVKSARGHNSPLLLSNALLSFAESALLAGDAQTASKSAAEAQQRFAAAKQHESEWRALLIEAQASEKIGDKARAQHLAQQASTILAGLEQEWGSDWYRTYLTRRDVGDLQKQLGGLLIRN